MNRNTPEDLVNDLIHRGKSLACDEDGFVTLTDKEGNSYVAQTNKEERDRFESTGKPLSKVKKEKTEKAGKSEGKKETKETEKKSAEKKPETEKKAETNTEKKIKIRVGNMDYEFSREQAEKQLKYDEKYIPETKNEIKDFTEKKKSIDKERETVDSLDKFYTEYKKELDNFSTSLSAASYLNKYKDRFDYLKGQALKTVKNDTRLDHNKTEQRQKEYSEKAKDLFRQSALLRDNIENTKNDLKRRVGMSDSLRKAMAQDSALEKYFDNLF